MRKKLTERDKGKNRKQGRMKIVKNSNKKQTPKAGEDSKQRQTAVLRERKRKR